MQIKLADDKQPQLDALEALLTRPDVDGATRRRIEQEIRMIRAGVSGEREAAYEIEFHLGSHKNQMTIHDLRIECDGRVAQIDHLIINRLLDIWVCESKHFAEGVAINDHGEWVAFPPADARVLCLDEFGPLNLQPRLGHGWHRSRHPVRFRATYTRTAGVRHLLAAYDPATGRLYGHIRATKTWREVRELLRSLRARFAEPLVVVLDNFSPHHKAELREWAVGHDIELVYLPTYASWLNLIECQFQALRRFALNGTDYGSHAEQDRAIHAYLRWHNRNARPAKPWRIKAEVHHSLPDVAA